MGNGSWRTDHVLDHLYVVSIRLAAAWGMEAMGINESSVRSLLNRFNPLGSGMGNGRMSHHQLSSIARRNVSIRLAAAWGMEGCHSIRRFGIGRHVSIRLAAAWGMEERAQAEARIFEAEKGFNPLGSGMGNGSVFSSPPLNIRFV